MIYFIAIFSTMCALNFIIALIIRKDFKGDKDGQVWWFVNIYTYVSFCCCFVAYGSVGTIWQWPYAQTIFSYSWIPFVIYAIGFYYDAYNRVEQGR